MHKKWLNSLLFLALLLVSGCGNDSSTTRYEHSIRGYQGEARFNPFLAAERYLGRYGIDASSRSSWIGADSSVGLVVLPLSALASESALNQAREWMEEGGHLVLCATGCSAKRNDWRGDYGWGVDFSNEDTAEVLAFIEERGAVLTEGLWNAPQKIELEDPDLPDFSEKSPDIDLVVRSIPSPGGSIAASFVHNDYFVLTDATAWDIVAGNKLTDEYDLISQRYGFGGRLTLLNDAAPFRNAFISQSDNAELLRLLHDMSGYGDVLFIYGADPSFMGLLWAHGKVAVILLAVLVGAWLWKNLGRWGRVRAESDEQPNSYAAHISTMGSYFWRSSQSDALISPLRRDVLRQLGLPIDEAPDTESLAQKYHLPEADLRDAFLRANTTDPSHYLRDVRTLRSLQKKLSS